MNGSMAQTNNELVNPALAAGNLNNLVVELEHYRRRSEWLSCVNDLHARLAGAVDLTAMIEAFSVWLMPLVPHDLIGYRNPERERVHMFCSCHGPERRHVVDAASDIFNNWAKRDEITPLSDDDFHVYDWKVKSPKGTVLLVVLRKSKQFSDYESHLIDKGLTILQEPLQRALEYEDLYEQASRDSLTGLANRRVFDERIDSLIGSARRHDHQLTLACMDLDKFKQINDTFGHMVGDLVLQKVSRIMEAMVRSCDLLVRMGGDEFMLVMSSTGLKDARILAERLCHAIEELDLPVAGKGCLGISIGLCEWDAALSKEDWIQQADEALYQAKEEGRSRVCIMA